MREFEWKPKFRKKNTYKEKFVYVILNIAPILQRCLNFYFTARVWKALSHVSCQYLQHGNSLQFRKHFR